MALACVLVALQMEQLVQVADELCFDKQRPEHMVAA
jgi:hypothetical protein